MDALRENSQLPFARVCYQTKDAFTCNPMPTKSVQTLLEDIRLVSEERHAVVQEDRVRRLEHALEELGDGGRRGDRLVRLQQRQEPVAQRVPGGHF